MEPPSSSSKPSQSALGSLYSRLSSWRASLELPNPGTVENLQKEVKSMLNFLSSSFSDSVCSSATHLTNYAFDGGRADLTKNMSMNPLFQVTHSFALGSQTMAPSYNFGAIYATENVAYTLFSTNI